MIHGKLHPRRLPPTVIPGWILLGGILLGGNSPVTEYCKTKGLSNGFVNNIYSISELSSRVSELKSFHSKCEDQSQDLVLQEGLPSMRKILVKEKEVLSGFGVFPLIAYRVEWIPKNITKPIFHKPTRNLVRELKPTELQTLKPLLGECQIHLKICFLKIGYQGEPQKCLDLFFQFDNWSEEILIFKGATKW